MRIPCNGFKNNVESGKGTAHKYGEATSSDDLNGKRISSYFFILEP
jgi:hypothetical protein